MIELMPSEVNELMRNNLERFEVTYDAIPKPETLEELEDYNPSDYIDRHGDEMRILVFIDKLTGKEHCLNYKCSHEYGFDCRTDSFMHNDSIEIIPEVKKIKVEEPKPLTEVELRLEKIKNEYNEAFEKGDFVEMPRKGKQNIVPKDEIKKIMKFLSTEKFSLLELLEVIYPVAIKYKVDQKSLWTHLQVKRGVWK